MTAQQAKGPTIPSGRTRWRQAQPVWAWPLACHSYSIPVLFQVSVWDVQKHLSKARFLEPSRGF